jgi:RNA polymerase sigma factor (sigma-70 family)
MSPSAAEPGAPSIDWNDERLVEACLRDDQRAWAVLIDRYKSLIYYFARSYGAEPHDAADVFQLVCVDLYLALPRLRNPRHLRTWITTVASHRALHWKRRHLIHARREANDPEIMTDTMATMVSNELEAAERAQIVRDALVQLSPRCREMLTLLFFEEPTVPYRQVASRLGLTCGSIGCIRARCLKQLGHLLEGAGLRQPRRRDVATPARFLPRATQGDGRDAAGIRSNTRVTLFPLSIVTVTEGDRDASDSFVNNAG